MNEKVKSIVSGFDPQKKSEIDAKAAKAAEGITSNVRVMAARRVVMNEKFKVTGVRFITLTNGNGDYKPASFTTNRGFQIPASAFSDFCDFGDGSAVAVAKAAYELEASNLEFKVTKDDGTMMPARDIKVTDPDNTERTVHQDAYFRHDYNVELAAAE